ncbi:MAG: hypothetical protein ACK4SX_05770 [Alcanivoracaceae bacterium]
MKRIFAVALLCLTSLAEAQIQRSDLLLLELSAWRARAGFHQLSINGNAPDDMRALQQVLATGATHVERIRAGSGPGELEAAGALVSLWQDLDRRAQDNPLATLGYADFNAFSELNTLVVQIRDYCARLSASAAPGNHDALLEMGIGLQRMASEYLALTAFPSAGINTGTSETAINFSSEAMNFERALENQEKHYRSDDRMRRMLVQIRTRWSFIRNAVPELDDPNSAKVPLLFHRYSNQITQDLFNLSR